MSSQSQHPAAVLESKGAPLSIRTRPTPTPGPTEVLVEVKSIALNPIDNYMREAGFVIDTYPTVIGSDISGIIVATGSSATKYKTGTRVAGFAPTFFVHGAPDYGAFQAKTLLPEATVTPLPEGLTFNEAALLPMSVLTAWSGLWTIGVPLRDPVYTAQDKKGILVWGGASSIGSGTVQTAKMLGFTVYATASEKHHDYIKSLGAKHVFDYKDADVVEKIVKAIKEDGNTVQHAFDAVGQVRACMDVLKEFKSGGSPQVATAVPMFDQAPQEEGVEAKFVLAPTDKTEQTEFFAFVFNDWLQGKLGKGEFKPSPGMEMVDGGLEGLSKGLDILKGGMSGKKVVLEL
ncbi:MAG: hypothetical protein LQ343_000082 [Gyalolechia ehrenbergii]|nr:MAG: hypothetical protein LQ343_000082 [Gyalolechia ehrenbergii]